jgi:hypothetical protein
MDNIGGFQLAEYVFADNVKSCAVVSDKIIVILQSDKLWNEIPATPGKIEITVIPSTENGLTKYSVSGIIYCPRPRLSTYNEFSLFKRNKILLKYTTGNVDVLVAGDKETPLTVISENVNPSLANGYSGVKLSISGLMTHPELVLFE